MRWPSRRGAKGLGAQEPAPAPLPTVPAARPQPGWSALPPIAPTWGAQSPLTTAPQPIRPPLTQGQPNPRPLASIPDGAPEPGRVIGLAAVVQPVVADLPAAPAELPAYFHQQPPLRHVTARPVVEHAPLTAATDDYVGQPVAPTPPPTMAQTAQTFYQQQNAERAAAAQNTAATDAGARFQEALANLHKSGLPTYQPGGGDPTESRLPERPDGTERPTPPRPPPGIPAFAPPSGSGLPPMMHRRNSLAESRRLGLGAPLRKDGTSEDGDDASDSEPDRGPVASAAAPHPPLVHPPVPEQSPEPPTAASAPAAVPAAVPASAPAPPVSAEPPSAAEASAARPSRATGRHLGRDARDEEDPGDDDGPGSLPPRDSLRPATAVARPIADGTARPTESVTPLVFRAGTRRPTLAGGSQPTRSPERAVVTRPPAELAQALRGSHGIDVTDVPVHRDTEATTEAGRHRARAFTRGGRVFLPEAAGALSSAQARGLLAHELVHAAQQRRLGGALPEEDSAEGRVLEAEAIAAERLYTHPPTVDFDDLPLVHAPQPVSAGWVDRRIVQRAEPVDYFEPSTTLSDTEKEHFKEAADAAVTKVMSEYKDRHPDSVTPGSDGSTTTFENASEEENAERQFLDVINTELERRGEPPQSSLSDEDKIRVRNMLTSGSSSGGQNQVVESSQQSRWAEQTFGAGSALGGDIGGLLAWTGLGKIDQDQDVDAQGNKVGVARAHGAPDPNAPDATSGTGTGTGSSTAATEEQGRFSKWQESVFGVGSALGADIGGLAGFFGGNKPDKPDPDATRGGTAPVTPGGTGTGGTSGGVGSGGFRSHAHANYGAGLGGIDASTGLPRDHDSAYLASQGQMGSELDELDMDDLATRLYERLRSRLRRELLVDRERAGLLTDFK